MEMIPIIVIHAPCAPEPTFSARISSGRIIVTSRPGIMLMPALVTMARPSRCLTLRVESGTISAWLML